ncbi:MAG: hypothetical protein RJB61_214 [Actinomycetota bacterium]|jgi:uncharacterized protein with FMN-binding domain
MDDRSLPSQHRTRRGPAAISKVASLVLSLAATFGLAALFARADRQQSVADGINGPDGAGSATSTALTPSTLAPIEPGTPSTSGSSTVPGSEAPIADGTYDGDAFTNRWGIVQLAVTYEGGQIVDVTVLQYPDGDRKSVSINQRALPSLEAAVLAAQSADISSVTGATITSRSYRQSLQSALDAAAAASAGVQG